MKQQNINLGYKARGLTEHKLTLSLMLLARNPLRTKESLQVTEIYEHHR